jgi:hypothetical protein
MIICWAAKGGSGTTVIASALAVLAARAQPAVLVDIGGDCLAALGVPDPAGPGLSEWLASDTAGADALERLTVPVGASLRLLARGHASGGWPADVAHHRWVALVDALSSLGTVVVDAGTGPPPPELHAAAARSLLITRPCFLALRRAIRLDVHPTGIILVNEPGRALRGRDVEHALGVAVVADVLVDPAVSRAVDAGLLAARLPRALVQQLRGAA